MPILKMSKYEYQPLLVIYPHEEREKLKKAKREAAQLALAKAKAQKSGNRKNKAKGSSQKSKRLTIKRKPRRRLPKRRKERMRPFVEKIPSDLKADIITEYINHACTKTNVKECSNETVNLQSESHTYYSSCKSMSSDTQDYFQHSACDIGKIDEKVADNVTLIDERKPPILDCSSISMNSSPPLSSTLSLLNAPPWQTSNAKCANSTPSPFDHVHSS